MKQELKIESGKYLENVRNALGYNQKAMAELLKMGESKYSRLENGKIALNAETLALLKKEFNVLIHYLVSGEGEMFANGGMIHRDKTGMNNIDISKLPGDLHELALEMRNTAVIRYSILEQYHIWRFKHKELIDMIDAEDKKNPKDNKDNRD